MTQLALALPCSLKIKKRGRNPDVMLARQTLLNCAAFDNYGHGCDGGDTVDVFGRVVHALHTSSTHVAASQHSKGCRHLKYHLYYARRYMHEHGLPDEACMLYNATDHTKFGPNAKTCPPEGKCYSCVTASAVAGCG
jgi:cathepsin X